MQAAVGLLISEVSGPDFSNTRSGWVWVTVLGMCSSALRFGSFWPQLSLQHEEPLGLGFLCAGVNSFCSDCLSVFLYLFCKLARVVQVNPL